MSFSMFADDDFDYSREEYGEQGSFCCLRCDQNFAGGGVAGSGDGEQGGEAREAGAAAIEAAREFVRVESQVCAAQGVSDGRQRQ